MRILVACEESQAVCKAFRAKGHEAYSCDIEPCSGGHPEWHIQNDVTPLLEQFWDMIIAFPPCTYLSNAGACRLYPKKGQIDTTRYEKGLKGKDFFMKFFNANCDKICIENPVPSKIFGLPPRTQVIQPYEYGHPYTKKTYLWLKGLQELVPTNVVYERHPYVCGNAEKWKQQAANGIIYGKEKSAKYRSKTFPGIANAMADQWGRI